MSSLSELDRRSRALSGAALHLRQVEREFPGAVRVLDGIDLDIAPGEFVAILGPSGCGKSTLLRIIAGLDKPDRGSFDARFSDAGRRRGLVFQDAHLLPWRNTLSNVALPLELMGMARAQRLAAAEQALAHVGLGDALERYPAQLSGGMRMRASLARALVTHPSLLLLDEPFAALDEITRQQLDEELHRLWREHRMTVIFVTHSIVEAAFLAERAIVLTRRPARVILDHRIQLPEQRIGELRTDARFAKQMGILFEGLQRGEGAGT